MNQTVPVARGYMTVGRRYAFEAAHYLPYVPDEHKCKRMHGHNYEIEVFACRREDDLDSAGFVIDFWDLDKYVDPLIAQVDHRTLNDIKGLENPTAESIARWFFDNIKLDSVYAVRVWETKNCYAEYQRHSKQLVANLNKQDHNEERTDAVQNHERAS